MSRLAKLLVLVVLPVALWGCGHDLDDCIVPSTVTFGPAGAPPSLNACTSYAVLAGNGVSCSGTLVTIDGDVGCSPSGSVNGVPSGQPTHGNKHQNDSSAAAAQAACTAVYNDLSARDCNGSLSGVDLGGRTFSGGTYCFSGSSSLNGTLTLDALGNVNAVFIIQVANDFTCGNNSVIVLANGAQAKNVFWKVGGNTTIGNNCTFKGNVVTHVNIVVHQNSHVRGRLHARTGSVSLDDCSVDLP